MNDNFNSISEQDFFNLQADLSDYYHKQNEWDARGTKDSSLPSTRGVDVEPSLLLFAIGGLLGAIFFPLLPFYLLYKFITRD